jgi:hypothetical protein
MPTAANRPHPDPPVGTPSPGTALIRGPGTSSVCPYLCVRVLHVFPRSHLARSPREPKMGAVLLTRCADGAGWTGAPHPRVAISINSRTQMWDCGLAWCSGMRHLYPFSHLLGGPLPPDRPFLWALQRRVRRELLSLTGSQNQESRLSSASRSDAPWPVVGIYCAGCSRSTRRNDAQHARQPSRRALGAVWFRDRRSRAGHEDTGTKARVACWSPYLSSGEGGRKRSN